MTTDSSSKSRDSDDPPRPRVVIALPQGSPLREKLVKALRDADVDVDLQSPGRGDVGDVLGEQEADVVVVRRSQLPDDATELFDEHTTADGSAGLVVMAEDDDPVDRVELLSAGASRVLDSTQSVEELASMVEAVAESEAAGGLDGPEIRGNEAQPKLADFLSRSASMKRFLQVASRVATADASLLITGETGVGKERLARAVHAESERAEGPFVAVNCGAMPEHLLESQLFGHARGAFTGADTAHKGFFEQATGGTIFLDEIGEVPLHLQVKLLTALQRHEVQRLGSEESTTIDVRVMAATNRDLREAIARGEFREDLFYRLNVISLEVPPLRERSEDIADLVGVLMQYFRGALPDSPVRSLSEEAMAVLMDYAWPGNVRELINVIERGMLLCTEGTIGVRDLPEELVVAVSGPAPSEPSSDRETGLPENWEQLTLKEVREAAIARAEREFLDAALRKAGGRIADVAKQAGIGTRSLYDKMQRYELRKEDYKES